MIMSGYEYRGKECFKSVYFTGIVRDKQGRKMSKSLGNSPDPIELMEKYGADGVRMGMLLTSPAGNDLPFDESLCEQGRNFNNKIWNAFRLVKGWETGDIPQPESSRIAVEWFRSKLFNVVENVDDLFGKYRLSEALMDIYKLFWDEFSSWYLEMIKPAYQQPIDKKTYESTVVFFDTLLKLLHPFMPFITEELWQALDTRKAGDSIMVAPTPKKTEAVCNEILTEMEAVKEIVSNIRTVRLQKNIPNKESLQLEIAGEYNAKYDAVIAGISNLDSIKTVAEKSPGAVSFLVGTTEYAVPLGNMINVEEEMKKIEAEIAYYEGFLISVMKKLGNERFVTNAKPEIVAAERKKKADAESKIASLKETISVLKGA
ncbi:MAG: class I tRNA ligase family protein, partial [Prevotellaceae bacterium]|jgi:valyl-tRNA synthetase|nr:class I tRNA ligase family protein [Prevotellaceae bacterium]